MRETDTDSVAVDRSGDDDCRVVAATPTRPVLAVTTLVTTRLPGE
ncbi:hypothetical protein [Halobaculum sp. MBLA0143]